MATGKQSPLVLYLIMLFGAVLGYLYNSQSDPTLEVVPVDAQYQLASMQELVGLSIDYSLLESPEFKALRVFGELPVRPQQPGGKSNPFQ